MRVWLITVGEPLPTDGTGDRLYRCGLIAQRLARAGIEVLWWSSTLDHIRKRQRAAASTTLRVDDKQRIVLLRGPTYRKNVSVSRMLNHLQIAREFRRLAPTEERPDVILCSLPTLELCDAATQYGAKCGVPVVLDVRDLWPDTLLDLLPAFGRGITKQVFHPMFRTVRRACRTATAIIGISPGFVEWGLRYAGRERTAMDRVFPMAYSSSAPSVERQAAARARWSRLALNDEGLNVCYFGTMGRQFELETVIRAARKLESEARPVRFILCGDGENRPNYEKFAAGLQSVAFPGWINEAEIWVLMQQCHVGLAPYVDTANFTENLPNKPLEYLSAGLPVVSSVRGYLERILDQHECGITYRTQDADGLADVLSALAADRSRLRQMSQNARSLYERQFRAETVYGGLVEYLRTLRPTA